MIKIDFKLKDEEIKRQLEVTKKLKKLPKLIKNRLVAETIKQVKELTPVGVPPELTKKENRTTKIKINVMGENGRYKKVTKTFLTKEGDIWQRYWAGYRGGSLRGAWMYKHSDDFTAMVFNPLEYASYVEKGHRGQPGRYIAPLGKKGKTSWVYGKFFLKRTEKNIESRKNTIAQKALEEYLKKCGL